jgi:hypothetical protein
MIMPERWREAAWWKAYVIYLAIVLPPTYAAFHFVHTKLLAWIIFTAAIFTALAVKDEIQRRWWR